MFSLFFISGYDRSIPGIPRYSVLGSDNSGQFGLQISNVSLSDDADYECQVGPASYNKPIRASAHLHVLCEYLTIPLPDYHASLVKRAVRGKWNVGQIGTKNARKRYINLIFFFAILFFILFI